MLAAATSINMREARAMDRIWLKNYPPGVPADIDPARYPSLVAMLEESFAKHRDADAYLSMDKTLTYGQLDEMSDGVRCLAAGPGPRPRRPRRHHDAERAAVPGGRRSASCAPAAWW